MDSGAGATYRRGVPPRQAKDAASRSRRTAKPPARNGARRADGSGSGAPQPAASSDRVPPSGRRGEHLLRRSAELEAKVAELDALLTRSERTVKALRDVGLALGSTLDLDQLLELILRKIADLLEADRATLYLLDEHRQRLLSRIIIGDEAKSIELPVGCGVAGHVAKYGQTIRIRDAYKDRRFSRHWDEMTGYRTRSVLASPMKNHVGRTIGVIQVLNKRGSLPGSYDEFSQHDEELLTALATQAAVSIDNSRLFLSVIQKNMQLVETKEQLEHRVADLKLLFELESSMARASTFEDLARAVVAEAARACGAQAGGLMVDEGEDGVFLYFIDVARGQPAEVRRIGVRRGEGIVGLAMRTNEAQHLPPADAPGASQSPPVSSRLGSLLGLQVRSAIAMPLEGPDDTPIGALGLYNAMRPGGFSQDARALLRLISANASTAVRLYLERLDRERSHRLTSIGRLLSGVMHDLRTPLTVINGYVQLMARSEDSSVRAEHAQAIAKQFDAIAAMQREVLEFARGERAILIRKVFLEKYFGDVEKQVLREIDGTKVRFVMELRDRGTARFDEVKIQRLLGNLIRNALEAMGGGGVLTLRVERQGEDLVITVMDTGRGIPDEIRHRLFKSFVTSGKAGGTGLGLAIVRKIVEEHGGTVAVESSELGTKFVVKIPQHDPEGVVTRPLLSASREDTDLRDVAPPRPADAGAPRRRSPRRPTTTEKA